MNREGAVAVTGAAGYVGQRICAGLLTLGVPVLALVRPNQTAPPGTTKVPFDDTQDASSLAATLSRHEVRAAVHLAARYARHHTADDITPLVQSNVLLGTILLDALTRAGARHVVVADSAFAHQAPRGLGALGLYGATRQAFARIVEYYEQHHALQTTTLVVHDVYGPQDARRRLVPVLLDAASNGHEVTLVGAPVTVDLVHVDDVANAFIVAVTKGTTGTWAVRSPEPLTPLQIADLLDQHTERPLTRRVVQAGGGPHPGTWAGPLLPGWAPSRTLSEGLAALIASES